MVGRATGASVMPNRAFNTDPPGGLRLRRVVG